MLAKFSFEYGIHVTPEEVEKLHDILDCDITTEKREIKENSCQPEKTLSLRSWTTYEGDIEAILKEFPYMTLNVKEIVNHDKVVSGLSNVLRTLSTAIEKADRIFKAAETLNSEHMFNDKCHVHVPNLGLLVINEVDYECDFCTERLQQRLDAGWRIIVACPQPDQRRPDYILGRYSERR